MKMIITAVLNIVTVGAGVWAGTAMNSVPITPVDGIEKIEEVVPNEAKADAEEPTKDLLKDVYSLRFTRPFVVPVTDGWRTDSLIVLTLNIELEREVIEGIPALQNRTRDRVMAGLMGFSQEGGFSGAVTDPVAYDGVRGAVRKSLEPMFEDAVVDVLILEMVKRSV